jgi:hypothetical protein
VVTVFLAISLYAETDYDGAILAGDQIVKRSSSMFPGMDSNETLMERCEDIRFDAHTEMTIRKEQGTFAPCLTP